MSMDGSAAAPGMRWCVYNWYRERPSHHMSGAAHSSYDEMVCVVCTTGTGRDHHRVELLIEVRSDPSIRHSAATTQAYHQGLDWVIFWECEWILRTHRVRVWTLWTYSELGDVMMYEKWEDRNSSSCDLYHDEWLVTCSISEIIKLMNENCFHA